MDFIIGDKVQAVDELGRWEEGRVVTADAETQSYCVKFVGWGEKFNRLVSKDEIRQIYDPFHEPGHGRGIKRGSQVASVGQLQQLKMLAKGDLVKFIDTEKEKEGHVLLVDRFHRTIVLDTEFGTQEIPACHLKPEEVPKVEQLKPRKKKLKFKNSQCRVESNNQEDSCTYGAEQEQVTDTCMPSMTVPMLLKPDGQLIEVGKCYQYGPVNFATSNIVCDQDKNTNISGFLILNGKVDHSVKIEMPANKNLQHISPALDKLGKDYLKSVSLVHSKQVQKELLESCGLVRQSVRRSVIASYMRKEIAISLSSRSHRRRFCLGVCSFEHDIEMLCIDLNTKKSEFSYKNNTISKLDGLLGDLWDIKCVDDNQFRFVTQVVVRLKDFQLTVSVMTATSRFVFEEKEYRNTIMSLELVPDQMSDNEETNILELGEELQV